MPHSLEQLLDQSWRILLDHLDEGVHVVDSNGVTVYYNRRAGELEGMRPQDVVGRHIIDVYPSLNGETSTLLNVCASGDPILKRQQSFTNYRGVRITTINSTLPIFFEGRLLGAIEISKDYTAVRELSERIVDLHAKVSGPIAAEKETARYHFADIIGQSRKIVELKSQGFRAAQTSASVLVFGETGTGKELFVQSIHNAGPRASAPFVSQNCAALPETLLESILFGTVKGSFTGAENRPGLFEVASGGTLFLDEINAMSLPLQAKLLRVLQEGSVRRVGDTNVRPVDVRIMAAMNVPPEKALSQGLLRHDLYFRINVISLSLPALREHKDDVPLLIQHFVDQYNQKLGKHVMGVSPQALELMQAYEWPGNIRELQNVMEAAISLMDGDVVEPRHLPPHLQHPGHTEAKLDLYERLESGQGLRQIVGAIEDDLINVALSESHGNLSQAAALLKLPRQTLQYRIRRG
jgi:arginine utilization regulatory protein